MPKERRTNNASSMLFYYCCRITSPAGNSGRQKGCTRHVSGYDEMENTEIIHDGCIALLSIFPMGLTTSVTRKETSEVLLKARDACFSLPESLSFIKRVQDCADGCTNKKSAKRQDCSCFDIYDYFIKEIDKQRVSVSRLYLGTTYTVWREKTLRVDIFLKLLTAKNLGIIDLNVTIDNLTVEETIALRHVADNATLLSREEWGQCFYPTADIKDSCTLRGGAFCSLFNEIANLLMPSLPKHHSQQNRRGKDSLSDEIVFYKPIYNLQTIIELRSIGDFAVNDINAHEWALNHAQIVYGLLTGDEAIGFIPEELTSKRLSSHWSSRLFLDVLAFGKNVLVLNSKATGKYGNNYIDFQENLNKKYNSDVKRIEYFKGKPCMAGLDHGVLQAVERNMVIRYYYDFIDKQSGIDGKKLNKQRQKLLSFITASSSSIDEINELFETISKASGTNKSIDLVRNKLNIQSEEINIDYQNKNNGIILLLTILSLTTAICAIQQDTIILKLTPLYRVILAVLGILVILSLIILISMKIADNQRKR